MNSGKNNITSHWALKSNIQWIKELAFLIKNKLSDIPLIIPQTIGLDTLYKFLFIQCVSNKEQLVESKSLKKVFELFDYIGVIKSIKDAGRDPYFCNQYKLNKVLTKKFLKSELNILRIKCENKNFKSIIENVERENQEISGEVSSLNRILEVAQTKIKKQRKEMTFDLAVKLYPDLKKIISSASEECRFKNGNLNCSKLGNKFNIDHKTAKSWCEKLGIPLSQSYLQ